MMKLPTLPLPTLPRFVRALGWQALLRADDIWHRWVCVRVEGWPWMYPEVATIDEAWLTNWPAELTEMGAEEFDRFLRSLAEARGRDFTDAP